jgi:hypothetical protein
VFLFATREDIEQLKATRTHTENFNRKGKEKDDGATMAAIPAQIETESWYVDSGATKHMTCYKN